MALNLFRRYSLKAPSLREPRIARRSRPCFEVLEDRYVPSTFTVNTVRDVVNPRDGKLSLREAITQANHHHGADVIVLPAGVFRLTRAGDDNINAAGDLDILDTVTIQGAGAGASVIDGQQRDRIFDVAGTSPRSIRATFQGLTLRNGFASSQGGGGAIHVGNADLVVKDCVIAGNRTSFGGGGISNALATGTGNVTLIRTTVTNNRTDHSDGGILVTGDSHGQGSVLTIWGSTIQRNQAGESVGGVLADLLVMNNSTVRGNVAAFFGGGIFNQGTAILRNSKVLGNTAGLDGGGILGGNLTLANCTVGGNSSARSGGGINVEKALLIRSIFRSNTARNDGGGILASVEATLFGSTVIGNFALQGNGGGIHSFSGNVSATNCTINGNSAQQAGGGINADNVTLTNCTVSGNQSAEAAGGGVRAATNAVMTGCTLSGNSAQNGGGFFGPAPTMTNCTVSGNSAQQFGGGIFAGNTATLLNVTITKNSAHTGGGVHSIALAAPASVRNSIIAQNFVDATGAGPDVSGAFNSQGHNLIGIVDGSATGIFTLNSNGDLVGTTSRPVDARLAPLANNGGPTFTHALMKGSLAIDHGDNSSAPAADQRGILRPLDGDGNKTKIVDIGAFEKN